MNASPPRAPLSIAVNVIQHGDAVLLLRRHKPPYQGLWSLPGGKIEADEDLKAAALREAREETGLNTRYVRYAGLVCEHLVQAGQLKGSFLLHLSVLQADTDAVVESEEGPLRWFSMDELRETKEPVIPSDLVFLEELVFHPTRRYLFCELSEDSCGDFKITELALE